MDQLLIPKAFIIQGPRKLTFFIMLYDTISKSHSLKFQLQIIIVREAREKKIFNRNVENIKIKLPLSLD